MNRLHFYLLALGLTVAGLGLFLYKALVLQFPLTPRAEAAIWNLEVRVTFTGLNDPVKAALFIPRSTARYAVMNEAFISRGYGLSTATDDLNRQAVWSIRKAKGPQSLYYRAQARRVDLKETGLPAKPPQLENPAFAGPDLVAAETLVAEIRRKSADTQTLVGELFRRLSQQPAEDNAALLLSRYPGEWGKVDLAAKILAMAGIPARVVHCVPLKEARDRVTLGHWLEFYDRKDWHAYDPASGRMEVPKDYLPWWWGPEPLVQLTGASNCR